MKNKKWKQFEKLTDQCYMNMIEIDKDGTCWEKAFELLMEIVREERQKEPNCFQEVYMLDENTDYQYDISGWIEDCLDEIDMREEYEVLLCMCDTLLRLFSWPDYTGSDLKFRKSSVLAALGRNKEVVSFCCKWFEKEPENIMAATAYVYALIGAKEYEAAEKLIHQFIIDESECLEENEIMFRAAAKYYAAIGDKTKKKQLDKVLKEYETYVDRMIEEEWLGSDEDGWEDEELPFD